MLRLLTLLAEGSITLLCPCYGFHLLPTNVIVLFSKSMRSIELPGKSSVESDVCETKCQIRVHGNPVSKACVMVNAQHLM